MRKPLVRMHKYAEFHVYDESIPCPFAHAEGPTSTLIGSPHDSVVSSPSLASALDNQSLLALFIQLPLNTFNKPGSRAL